MADKKVFCVIPSRYASTRLPGKPLLDIAGKPMVQHVYEQALKAESVAHVIVATDDKRIFDAVEGFGGIAMMTSPDHASGTDRLAEVAAVYADADIIINIQGDEPMIDPAVINHLAGMLIEEQDLLMATAKTLLHEEEYDNPAAVKVVTDKAGYALYFSRSLIPYPRNKDGFKVYKHIGIYAYKRDFLLAFSKMEQSQLEKIESLEQLRALDNGYKIKVLEVESAAVGVDTVEDLEAVRRIMAGRK